MGIYARKHVDEMASQHFDSVAVFFPPYVQMQIL